MARRPRSLFETIRTEGGLLPPELLKRIAEGDGELPGLEPADYHLEPGARIGEAVTRSWNRLLGVWASFRDARAGLAEGAPDAGLTRDRWLLPLFQELGYGRLLAARGGIEIEGRAVPVSHRWHRSPIHLVGFRTDLDRRTPGVAGAARQSPHSLVQELLNRSDEHLWGFVSNGLRLRLLRDNASLTRQAFVEFDLEAMMEGEAYADFAVLWLVCHQSRVEAERPEQCWLERWVERARDQGTRALERLRSGVEAAIQAFGQGFLAHPGNAALRDALGSGQLPTQDYYRELLRLVYRLLFLLVAEDRGLLLDPDAKPDAKKRYLEHYSTARLRRLAARRRGGPHPDAWRALRLVMGKFGDDHGCPELALPPLGSFLWSREALPHLAEAELANEHLLAAIRALAFTEEARLLRPVDWRNLDSEELGSVYESLLELHPEVEARAGRFELRSAAGHERKTTGSYYTPDSLVQCLLDTALDPVLDEACAKADPERALLALTLCDPACGSGHFLIAAARRLARRLAQIRTGDAEPDPGALQAALRDVIGRCLYGVDVNPMAVELCKVSLWLEALEPGKPLSFLGHQVRCGNSLLGATPALLAGGVPDEAFTPIEGDERAVANALKRRNRAERGEDAKQETMFGSFVRDGHAGYGDLASEAVRLRDLADDTIDAVHRKEAAFERLAASEPFQHERLLADAWCAAFVWPKREGAPDAPTTEVLLRLTQVPNKVAADTRAEIRRLAAEYGFFHWHLAFPEVFGASKSAAADGAGNDTRAGFDVVLSNPPWERIKLQEKEFFATRRPEIAGAPNAAARGRLIRALAKQDPALHDAFLAARREAEGASHFVRSSGRFPLCGRGDVNTYSVFAELMRDLAGPTGRVGAIVPSGIATDDTTKFFFQDLSERGSLASLYDFENRKPLFADVDSRMKFCLLTLAGSAHRAAEGAELAFFLHDPTDLADSERRFRLSAADIALLNPNTKTCPVFRTRRDAELTKWIYRRVPVLVREGPPEENPWGVSFTTMFHMSNDSHLFRTREQLEADGWRLEGNVFAKEGARWMPIYEGKMVSIYDHRTASIIINEQNAVRPQQKDLFSTEEHLDPRAFPLPYLWCDESVVRERSPASWSHGWFITLKRVTASTNERMLIGCLVPWSAISYTLYVVTPVGPPELGASLLGVLCSFAADYLARQKTSQPSLPIGPILETAVPAPSNFQCSTWSIGSLTDWLFPRALELTYTAWDLAPFACDLGYDGPPFRWDEERRFLLRCELDAAFLHLYLGSPDEWQKDGPPELLASFPTPRDAAAYLLDTFPIVRRKDEEAHGEYRTKRVILEIYDELLEATRSGKSYRTRLDPPPADPRLAHASPESSSERSAR